MPGSWALEGGPPPKLCALPRFTRRLPPGPRGGRACLRVHTHRLPPGPGGAVRAFGGLLAAPVGAGIPESRQRPWPSGCGSSPRLPPPGTRSFLSPVSARPGVDSAPELGGFGLGSERRLSAAYSQQKRCRGLCPSASARERCGFWRGADRACSCGFGLCPRPAPALWLPESAGVRPACGRLSQHHGRVVARRLACSGQEAWQSRVESPRVLSPR